MSDAPAHRDELRNSIDRDQLRTKPKFCLKLIRVLRYSAAHPDEIGELGCGWRSDRFHFVCNAQILAAFMGLKPNSINTNMRDHGFVMDSIQTSDLLSEYGPLPDIRHWKIRQHPVHRWTVATTDAEADQIPAKDGSTRGQLELVSAQPALLLDPVSRLIAEREETRRDIFSIMKAAVGSDTWREQCLRKATEEWLSLSADLSPIDPSLLVHRILASANPGVGPDVRGVIEANIRFLLCAQSNASQMTDGVSLLDFLRFTLRFGFLERIAQSVVEVSTPGFFGFQPYFTLSLNSQSQSQHEVDPCFATWFVPSSDRNSTAQILHSGVTWVVRMSSAPNCFTVEAQNADERIATHVRFDPIPMRANARFLVDVGGEDQGAESWGDLLEKVLGLELPRFQAEPVKQEKVRFVEAAVLSAAVKATDQRAFAKATPGAPDDFLFKFGLEDSQSGLMFGS
jgi:hypothetical protein